MSGSLEEGGQIRTLKRKRKKEKKKKRKRKRKKKKKRKKEQKKDLALEDDVYSAVHSIKVGIELHVSRDRPYNSIVLLAILLFLAKVCRKHEGFLRLQLQILLIDLVEEGGIVRHLSDGGLLKKIHVLLAF